MLINDKKTCIQAIKALGEDLINRAEDICNDLKRVASITIYANIGPEKVVNFDVTKNYDVKNID